MTLPDFTPMLPQTRTEWMEHYRMWETGRVIDHEYGGWKRKENRHMDLDFSEYIGIECPEDRMERILKLQRQRNDISRLHAEICEQIQQEAERYVAEKYGAKIGAIVKDISGYSGMDGKLFRVARMDVSHYYMDGKPYLMCNPQKKDGSFGTKERWVYEWEPVE